MSGTPMRLHVQARAAVGYRVVVVSMLVLLIGSCAGGSNLPSASRTITVPSRSQSPPLGPTPSPSRSLATRTSTSTQTTSTSTETSASTETSTETSTSTSTATKTRTQTDTSTVTSTPPPAASAASPSAAASGSSSSWWPWLLLALLVGAVIVAFVMRARSSRAAAKEAHDRALRAYTDAMAMHDRAAVLPMSAEPDRARMLGEVSADVDRTVASFDALAAEPTMQDASVQVQDVRLALTDLRGSLGAQVAAGGIDPDLLRGRLATLEAALQRFRRAIEPPASS